MDSYGKATGFITALVPDFMTKSVFGLNGGVDFYWPVVWMIIPAFIYLPLFFLALAAPFTYKEIKKDAATLVSKMKARFHKQPNAQTEESPAASQAEETPAEEKSTEESQADGNQTDENSQENT